MTKSARSELELTLEVFKEFAARNKLGAVIEVRLTDLETGLPDEQIIAFAPQIEPGPELDELLQELGVTKREDPEEILTLRIVGNG